MNVTLRMPRAENTAQYGTEPVTLDIEEYLCGACGSVRVLRDGRS